MRKSRFSEEQIVGILQEYAAGARVSCHAASSGAAGEFAPVRRRRPTVRGTVRGKNRRSLNVGEDILLGTNQERCEFGQLRAPLGLGRRVVGLGKGGSDEGCHPPAAAIARMGQGIALEMHVAALPGGRQDAGGGRLDALMGAGNHQLHA